MKSVYYIISLVIVIVLAGTYFFLTHSSYSQNSINMNNDKEKTLPDFSVQSVMYTPEMKLQIIVENNGVSVKQGEKMRLTVDGTRMVRKDGIKSDYISEVIAGHIYDEDVAPPHEESSSAYIITIPDFIFANGVDTVTVKVNEEKTIAESRYDNNTHVSTPETREGERK